MILVIASLNTKYYKRYVDDCFLIFEHKERDTFYQYINTWHPNLKFIVANGVKQIPFFDIDIRINDNSLETSVYRKLTYTGLLLNYAASVPMQWKTGLFNTLINRAYIYCMQ